MVKRTALLLRYKEPAIRWINEADSVEGSMLITDKHVNTERTVYLISRVDGESGETQQTWIKRIFVLLFESELEGWYTEPDFGPNASHLNCFTNGSTQNSIL